MGPRAAAIAFVGCFITCGCDPSDDASLLVGTTPAGLDAICQDHAVAHIRFDHEVDFRAFRSTTFYSDPDFEDRHTELWTDGVPCDGAADVEACEAALEATWAVEEGWFFNGWTARAFLVESDGDSVRVIDEDDELMEQLGEIDQPAEALFRLGTHELAPSCESLVETEEGHWRLLAAESVPGCEGRLRFVEVEVRRDGSVVELREVRSPSC